MRMSTRSWSHTLALCLALVACSAASPTEISYETGPSGVRGGYISVTATADGLTVSNVTERPVYLIAIEQETETRTDWIPCTGGSGCLPLDQGERRVIAWSSVLGYAPERKSYVVSWWHSVRNADGTLRVDVIQRLLVTR